MTLPTRGASSTCKPTADTMRARLRAYGLPTRGAVAALSDRLARLDAHRARYGTRPEVLAEMSVRELKDVANALGMKAWELGTKPRLTAAAQRLATMPEPSPVAADKVQQSTWSVVWRNPATSRMEAESVRMSWSSAWRRAGWLRTYFEGLACLVALHTSESYELDVRIVHEPHAYPVATYPTGAEEEAMTAWRRIADLEEGSAGPALSGDRGAARRVQQQIELALRDLESARREIAQQETVQ